MESIRLLKTDSKDISTLYYNFDKNDSLFNLANGILDQVSSLNSSIKNDIDWDNIFLAMREFVSKKAEQGVYCCNIFLDTEDMNCDKFSNWLRYLYAAEADNEPIVRRTCRDCGKEFYLFTSEIKFFTDRELSLPKRCKDCRAKRKQSRINR